MPAKILVLVKQPNCGPVVETIDNDLRSMQRLVKGFIELIGIGNDCYIVCNEDGKQKTMPPNFAFGNMDCIRGDAFFTRLKGSKHVSLTALDIARIRTMLYGDD